MTTRKVSQHMAQRTKIETNDDLTGEVIHDGAGRTVAFGFDGSNYEIDLTNEHVEHFRAAIEPYLAVARKAHRSTSSSRSRTPRPNNSAELARIREWATNNGYQVAERGRISAAVRDAYAAAH